MPSVEKCIIDIRVIRLNWEINLLENEKNSEWTKSITYCLRYHGKVIYCCLLLTVIIYWGIIQSYNIDTVDDYDLVPCPFPNKNCLIYLHYICLFVYLCNYELDAGCCLCTWVYCKKLFLFAYSAPFTCSHLFGNCFIYYLICCDFMLSFCHFLYFCIHIFIILQKISFIILILFL